jgi:hypothetical protein
MDKIRMLALSFNYNKQIEIEEARELLIYAGNIFIHTVNDDKRVHQYLLNYPFLPENIEIRIFLHKKNGSEFGGEKLSVISMNEGILKYKIVDPTTQLLTTIYSETFDEALVKINSSAGSNILDKKESTFQFFK